MKLQKFIIALVAIAILFNPTTSFAQGWVPFLLDVLDEDLSDEYDLKAPEVIDFYGNVGYALGDDGTMYKSLDNGKSWIGASDDGVGNTWIGFNSQWAIYNLYALAEDVVMIVSSGKYAHKSFDNAKSFKSTYLGYLEVSKSSWILSSAQISEHEYLFIDGDHLYKTEDAFETASVVYSAVSLGTYEYLCNIGASDGGDRVIITMCNSESVLVSDDAGSTFKRIELASDTDGRNMIIDFGSADVVYILSGTGNMYKSIDGGFNWDVVMPPDDILRFGNIDFFDADNGIATGYVYGYGQELVGTRLDERLHFTSDGGYSWTLMNSFIPYDYELLIRDLYFESPDRIFAVGSCDDGTESELNGACVLRYNTSNGILIKSDESEKVYYTGQDGLLHWIPDEETFYTWYENFDIVENVSQAYIDSIEEGDDVGFREINDMEDIGKVMN